jgi:hypothetical protein
MNAQQTPQGDRRGEDFRSQVEGQDESLVREFIDFLRHNKKWWLIPIVVVVGLLMFLVVLSLSPVAPFIYTLF